MLSDRVYRTDLPNWEDKVNKMQLISVHSFSLFSGLPRSPFCPPFHHRGSSSTTSDGSTGPSRALRISAPSALSFPSRLFLLSCFPGGIFSASRLELPTELAFPPHSHLFRINELNRPFLPPQTRTWPAVWGSLHS